MVLAHVHDAMGFGGVEADDSSFSDFQRTQRGSAAAVWGREVRDPNLGLQILLVERGL
jgi:hypothetical protein